MIRHFKLPMIVTAIVVPTVLVLGLIATFWIFRSDLSRRKKAERAEMLGTGLGTTVCIVIAPFWLVAAAKVGKERRASSLRR